MKETFMVERWPLEQRWRATGIVNDIAEGIDNRETRAELRQALAIYADMLYDARQKKQEELDLKLMDAIQSLDRLVKASNLKAKP